MSTTVAEANNGVKSVTLVPNIRKYNAAIGGSWAFKGAFENVEECQFVLVIKNDCFRNGSEE